MEILAFLIGFLTYHVLQMHLYKNNLDEVKDKFNLKKYLQISWDDILFGFIAAVGFYLIAPEIFLVMSLSFTWMENIYWSSKITFFIGAFGGLIFKKLYDLVKYLFELLKERIKKLFLK